MEVHRASGLIRGRWSESGIYDVSATSVRRRRDRRRQGGIALSCFDVCGYAQKVQLRQAMLARLYMLCHGCDQAKGTLNIAAKSLWQCRSSAMNRSMPMYREPLLYILGPSPWCSLELCIGAKASECKSKFRAALPIPIYRPTSMPISQRHIPLQQPCQTTVWPSYSKGAC